MTEKEIKSKIFVANDGTEFLEIKDCEAYEKVIDNIKYFTVLCHPDLTETGNYQHKIFVAVYSTGYCWYDIVMQWAINNFKGYLGVSVMGYGFQPKFRVIESDKAEYENCPPVIWGGTPLESEKVFLSPKSFNGFPENVNYVELWGFK